MIRTESQAQLDEQEARARAAKMADKLFRMRARKSGTHKGEKGVEVHLSELELTAALAIAFESGILHGRGQS